MLRWLGVRSETLVATVVAVEVIEGTSGGGIDDDEVGSCWGTHFELLHPPPSFNFCILHPPSLIVYTTLLHVLRMIMLIGIIIIVMMMIIIIIIIVIMSLIDHQ